MLYGQSHFLDAFLIRKTTSIFYFQESLLSAASASYMDNQRLLYNKKNHAILVSFFVRKFTFCIGLFKNLVCESQNTKCVVSKSTACFTTKRKFGNLLRFARINISLTCRIEKFVETGVPEKRDPGPWEDPGRRTLWGPRTLWEPRALEDPGPYEDPGS